MSAQADPKRLRRIKHMIRLGISKTRIAKNLGISRQRLYEIIGTESGKK